MQTNHYPEIWGGIECTIVRVGDRYYDQLEASGHYQRKGDIKRLDELGIKAIRYPLLWEKHQPVRDQPIDWAWADRQLRHLRKLNITPVAGLLHHGSGPAYTDLSQPGFAEDLAAYAGLVAARYPWIEYYTPVNEPLTTARFSGLYGLWYPHRKDDRSCITMLLNQIKGVVYSMKAIRQIKPAAKLVQTEDLSFTHSSPSLAYQADFENCRRWLSFDLLCGRVDQAHPLWSFLMAIGVTETELSFFSANPCPPDILGVNYYVTSERYLDEDIANYPEAVHGGNGRHAYADVAAARMTQPRGLLALMEEIWQRYRLPIAVTEVHLNCTREHQLRWLKEIWDAACAARCRGMDVRAVTPWALFGAYDWDSLLTAHNGNYESGAYRIENGVLNLTAVGAMVRWLAIKGVYRHPLLEMAGWWNSPRQAHRNKTKNIRPLLILADPANSESWAVRSQDRNIVHRVLNPDTVKYTLQQCLEFLGLCRPWAVVFSTNEEDIHVPVWSTACKLHGTPFLRQRSDDPDQAAMQKALDLLIDNAIIQEEPVPTDQYYRI